MGLNQGPIYYETLDPPMTMPSAVHSRDPGSYVFLGVEMRILLSSQQTGGQFSMIEGIMPPGGDGGLHVHHREDESMHLLEGELEVTIGDKVFMLAAGESYFAPRDVPQRLRNIGSVPARALLVTTPGGFDQFIAQAGVPLVEGMTPPVAVAPTSQQIGALLALAHEFGIEIIAPPTFGSADPLPHTDLFGSR